MKKQFNAADILEEEEINVWEARGVFTLKKSDDCLTEYTGQVCCIIDQATTLGTWSLAEKSASQDFGCSSFSIRSVCDHVGV